MNLLKDFFKAILYKPLFNLLMFFVWLIPGNSVGWAIIAITVLIRLILYPSQKKAIESQKKIQDLQPKMDEIKTKYANDQQAQAQALMDLYKTYNINPLSSCLPILIQMPIIFILYRVLTIGLTKDRFDLLYTFTPRPETINIMFMGMDLSQPSIFMAVLAGVLQFAQSYRMMAKTNKNTKVTAPKAKNDAEEMTQAFSKQMLYMFPIFTIIIAIKLPAALALYWIVTTLFMVIQQEIIYRAKPKKETVTVKIKEGK